MSNYTVRKIEYADRESETIISFESFGMGDLLMLYIDKIIIAAIATILGVFVHTWWAFTLSVIFCVQAITSAKKFIKTSLDIMYACESEDGSLKNGLKDGKLYSYLSTTKTALVITDENRSGNKES